MSCLAGPWWPIWPCICGRRRDSTAGMRGCEGAMVCGRCRPYTSAGLCGCGGAAGAGALYFDMAELTKLLQAEQEHTSTGDGPAAASASPQPPLRTLTGASDAGVEGGATALHPGRRVQPIESTPHPTVPPAPMTNTALDRAGPTHHRRWQRRFNPDSGEAYYVDMDTGVTSWAAPWLTAPTTAAATETAVAESAQQQLQAMSPLPPPSSPPPPPPPATSERLKQQVSRFLAPPHGRA